jgi:hypothetical protein
MCLILCVALVGCGDDSGGNTTNDASMPDAGASDSGALVCTDGGVDDTDAGTGEPRVGHEILQILSPTEIIVWVSADITTEQFDAIELPGGWFKNEPREVDMDSSSFARSPDATEDGPLTSQEHFGYVWQHNATVVEMNIPIDAQGLLTGNLVAKYHEIVFNPCRTLVVLVSPEGEQYVRVSRDAQRTTDTPTIPTDWQLVEHVTTEELVIQLPNPTLNIRADNEDSFQGPVTEIHVTP